ncbi:MAG: DUF302 domain-containing protein [Thiovulaceae bacterium]|nr:DUF302 domain-containing protein [Sulfurimonadaceae bacterium]
MKIIILLASLALTLSANGIIIKNSKNSVEKTMYMIQNIVTKKGFTVFAVVDHQANADRVRMHLAPSKEIIFGNPKMGTILMQENMMAGLDLPIRILVFSDKEEKTKIAYRDGEWLGMEHDLTKSALLNKMNFTLDNITTEAGR